jgi:large subunit ribosomal protein L29
MKKKEIKALSYAELVSKREELNKKYMDIRFQKVIGHLDNPLQQRIIRRDIAKLNTLIHLHDIAAQGNK